MSGARVIIIDSAQMRFIVGRLPHGIDINDFQRPFLLQSFIYLVTRGSSQIMIKRIYFQHISFKPDTKEDIMYDLHADRPVIEIRKRRGKNSRPVPAKKHVECTRITPAYSDP